MSGGGGGGGGTSMGISTGGSGGFISINGDNGRGGAIKSGLVEVAESGKVAMMCGVISGEIRSDVSVIDEGTSDIDDDDVDDAGNKIGIVSFTAVETDTIGVGIIVTEFAVSLVDLSADEE